MSLSICFYVGRERMKKRQYLVPPPKIVIMAAVVIFVLLSVLAVNAAAAMNEKHIHVPGIEPTRRPRGRGGPLTVLGQRGAWLALAAGLPPGDEDGLPLASALGLADGDELPLAEGLPEPEAEPEGDGLEPGPSAHHPRPWGTGQAGPPGKQPSPM